MKDIHRPVTELTVHPERIVSLSPSSTEILFAVGAGPKVVGITNYCNYPPELEAHIEADEITRVGGYWNPSIETIVELKPDLVLVSTAKCTVKTNECKVNCRRRCEITAQVAAQLRSLGLKVLTLGPHSMNDVLDDILLVGRASGNAAEASNLVEELRQRINSVIRKKAASHRPKVYFEVWNDPYMSVSSGTWIGDLINLAGGANIFGETVSEWPIIDSEDIIQRNPDIIVFPVIPDVPRFWGSFEEVKKRQGWKSINAVRNGNLYEVPRDFISRPGPRLVEALEMLEKNIHPSS
ncbi:MAG TPA: cobalamin-binding protein [Candidatus Bathyarchaeota archaeon]|nr:cobalamin-binding protein [Candidatus Bathyarchaeota archaeon]